MNVNHGWPTTHHHTQPVEGWLKSASGLLFEACRTFVFKITLAYGGIKCYHFYHESKTPKNISSHL